jgi:outer membrane protein assembly factor BamB
MVWCGTDGIISGVKPARQIRLGALALLLLLLAPTARSSAAAQGVAEPFGGRRARAPRPAAPKGKEDKTPALSARPEWTAGLPSAPSGQPAYDESRAFVPVESGEVAALSLADGAVAWKTALLPAGSLAAGGGLVFVPVAGAIEARDAETGAPRWRAPLDGPLSAPLVWQNGWLFVATTRGTASMLRASVGQPVWQQDLGAAVRTRAAPTGDRIYVGLENGQVRALKLTSGETLWSRALGGRPTTLAPLDDRVFAGSDDKYLYCLSAKDGKTDWRWRTGGAILGTPIFDEHHVYFLSLDNVLRALDRGNGHQVWQAALTFRPLAGPYFADDRLLVAGLMELRAFRVSNGSEAGGVEPGGVIAAPPHFLPADDDDVQPFVVFTREGQMLRLIPSGPPLPSKPFPATPIYPLWPGIVGQ